MSKNIPDEFIEFIFRERRRLLEKAVAGKARREDFLIGFLRHTPAVVSYGPAGLNASIKGIGFVVKDEYLKETIDFLMSQRDKVLKKPMEAMRILLEYFYVEEKIDFTKLSTIELARRHTWTNLNVNSEATLLFYVPPSKTYEVRCKATIHMDDEYWKLANLVHDLYHVYPYGRERDWRKTPVYVFHIKEIYDNNPAKMGEKIY